MFLFGRFLYLICRRNTPSSLINVEEREPRHADAEELIESIGLEKRIITPLVLKFLCE